MSSAIISAPFPFLAPPSPRLPPTLHYHPSICLQGRTGLSGDVVLGGRGGGGVFTNTFRGFVPAEQLDSSPKP